MPLQLSYGSGNLESSPTRSTRDLLLKVVPTVARVSLHLLLNPPRLRPLTGAAASYNHVLRPPALQRGSAARTPRLGGARNLAPGRFTQRGFHSGPKGAGRAASKDRARIGSGEPNWNPEERDSRLSGGNAGAAGCIPSSGIRFQPTWTVAFEDLDIQGRCAHTQRALLGAFIFRTNESSSRWSGRWGG